MVPSIVTDTGALRIKCIKVTDIPSMIPFCEEVLVKTMLKNQGFGLSANQVGSNARIIAIQTQQGPVVMINPHIKTASEVMALSSEECLSVPGKRGVVLRHKIVEIGYTNYFDRKKETMKLNGYYSFVFQHELDHLNGVLFTDKLAFANNGINFTD